LEEGTWAAWLYDLLKPHVTELVVCDPRKNAFMKEGNKSDKIDACKLADLLRGGYLRSVYHGENGLRTLKELARSYLTISKDLTRVMNRVKALYRSWGIGCEGQQVYAPRHRTEWLNKIGEAGVRWVPSAEEQSPNPHQPPKPAPEYISVVSIQLFYPKRTAFIGFTRTDFVRSAYHRSTCIWTCWALLSPGFHYGEIRGTP
jgi:Transposase